jgi:ribosome-associated toxin RatA of RatAB toxin-antitoxin module
MLGSTPSEFFLNYLFKNRVIGVLLAGVGTVLGIQVARSFSSRRA